MNRWENPTSPRSREVSSATPAYSDLNIALVWSFESPSIPIFLVETSLAHDSTTAAATARSAREYLSIRPSGKYVPARTLGVRSTMPLTGVASPRSRWPLHAVAPSAQAMSACAPMISFTMVSRSVRTSSLMSRSPSPWVGSCCIDPLRSSPF